MVTLIRSDLEFILEQILISEAHANGANLLDLLANVQLPFGLRTVDGTLNHLEPGAANFGAADQLFPRLTTPVFGPAENGTSYSQTSGLVIDSQPRIISNLIADQSTNNPAAVAAAGYDPALGLDGVAGTADDNQFVPSLSIGNVTPDEGLSAPFNAWMTFF